MCTLDYGRRGIPSTMLKLFLKYKIAEVAIENLFNAVIKEFSPNTRIIKTLYLHKGHATSTFTVGKTFFKNIKGGGIKGGTITKIEVLTEKRYYKDSQQYYCYIIYCNGVPVHSNVGLIESKFTIIYE